MTTQIDPKQADSVTDIDLETSLPYLLNRAGVRIGTAVLGHRTTLG